jgi:hypothetical protein
MLLRRSRLLIMVVIDPGCHCDGRDHGAASQLDEGKSALLRQAAHSLGANAAELAGRFFEVPEQNIRHE